MTMRVTTGLQKATIVHRPNLEAVSAESLGDEAPRFAGGLDVDPVDAPELVLAIEGEYASQIQDAEVGVEAFATARVVCEFINARLAAAPAPLPAPAPREQSA